MRLHSAIPGISSAGTQFNPEWFDLSWQSWGGWFQPDPSQELWSLLQLKVIPSRWHIKTAKRHQRGSVGSLVSKSCPTLVTSWTVACRLLCPWDSPGKNTGVGCHFLLQGLFPTQESNLILLYCRQILYRLRGSGNTNITCFKRLSKFPNVPIMTLSLTATVTKDA